MNCFLFGAPAVQGANPLLLPITFKCWVLSMLVEIQLKTNQKQKQKCLKPHTAL